MTNEIHIAGVVVRVRPEQFSEVMARTAAWPEAEVHSGAATSKFVVVLEAASAAEIQSLTERMSSWQGVLAVNIVYHHHESPESLAEELIYDTNAT
jgi:nitrate reductase NapAB chaperone NapD